MVHLAVLPGRVYTPAQRRALRPQRFLGEVEVAEDGDVADSEGGGAADSEGEEEQQPASQSARWVVWHRGGTRPRFALESLFRDIREYLVYLLFSVFPKSCQNLVSRKSCLAEVSFLYFL